MARYNGGFWKVSCPKHTPEDSDVMAEKTLLSPAWTENNEYICPVCHPKYYQRANKMVNGQVVTGWDISARHTGRLIAAEKGEIYTVEFPKDKDEIENILSVRNEIDPITLQRIGANWDGESLKELRKENKKLGYK